MLVSFNLTAECASILIPMENFNLGSLSGIGSSEEVSIYLNNLLFLYHAVSNISMLHFNFITDLREDVAGDSLFPKIDYFFISSLRS